MKFLIAALISLSSMAHASERVVLTLRCQNGEATGKVVVRTDDESKVSTVEWTIKDGKTMETNMGYVYGTSGWSHFDSLDTDERMELEGKVLTLTNDSKPEWKLTMICK